MVLLNYPQAEDPGLAVVETNVQALVAHISKLVKVADLSVQRRARVWNVRSRRNKEIRNLLITSSGSQNS